MDGGIDLGSPWRAIVRAPMARMAVPFIMGIVLAAWRTPPLSVAVTIMAVVSPAVALVLLLPAHRFTRWQRGLVVSLWSLCFGLFWQVMRQPVADPWHAMHHEQVDAPWAVRVENVNGTSDKLFRADARLLGQVGVEGVVSRRGRVMLALLLEPDGTIPRAGDRLLVDATLMPIDRIPDPGGFDRRAWAASRGIGMELFAPAAAWRAVDHVTRWTDAFTTARRNVSEWLDGSDLPKAERAVAKALVLGLRDELTGEQTEAYVRSGTIHILAVSGMHVALIYAILLFFFGWWGTGPRARRIRGVLVILALWGYTGLTGSEPSVLRATVMFSLFTLAGMFAQRTETLNSLFIAAFVLLLWDPAMFGMIGFQLSFLAVLGIILFYKPVERLWSPRNWLLRNIWSMAVVSLVAQLLTTPASLYHFKAFPVWFLPANLAVVAVGSLAVYGAVALLALYKVPWLGDALTWAMEMLLRFMDMATTFFSGLPGAYPDVRVDGWSAFLLYVLIAALSCWWLWKWRNMRWVAGASLALLLVAWADRTRTTDAGASFTVYDDRNGTFAAMVHGRDLVLTAGTDAPMDDPWLSRKVERHRRAHGLHVPQTLLPEELWGTEPAHTGPTLAVAGRWRSPAMDVAFLTDGTDLPTGLPGSPLDVLVIHDRKWIGEGELEAMAGITKHVVLAGGLGWKTRQAVLRWCGEQGVACHDVREEGAFVLER